MTAIVIWAVLIGTILHLLGAGGFFVGASGAVLALAFVVGAIGIILNLKTPKEVIASIVIGAFAASLLPAVIAGVLRDIWHGLSPVTIFVIGLGLLAAALFLRRVRR
jgi:hypothetical protein